jgi:hypothetical protein
VEPVNFSTVVPYLMGALYNFSEKEFTYICNIPMMLLGVPVQIRRVACQLLKVADVVVD